MVDAADPVGKFIQRSAEVFGQIGSGALHTVADADIFDFCIVTHRPADYRQRVSVVDQ